MEILHLFEEGGFNLLFLEEFLEGSVEFVADGLSGVGFQRFVDRPEDK